MTSLCPAPPEQSRSSPAGFNCPHLVVQAQLCRRFTFTAQKTLPFADIVDGNLKSTMRLILALAAHFKPGSGRAGTPGSGGRSWAVPPGTLRPRSAAAVAQGAVAVLADVRQDVQHSGRDVFRHRQR